MIAIEAFVFSILGLLIGLPLVFALAPPRARAELYDRDSESWCGRSGQRLPQGGVRLDAQAEVSICAGAVEQRFNPSVMATTGQLSNTQLYIQLPVWIAVTPSPHWAIQGAAGGTITYSARLGDINPGTRINNTEAMQLTIKESGISNLPIEVVYLIAARELSPPITGRFSIKR